MSIDSTGFIPPGVSLEQLAGLETSSARQADFGRWLDRQVGELNVQLQSSEQQLRALAAGDSNNLHQVMLDLEKAKLSFEFVMQIRNKALEAYREVIRMQL